jgi:hypothetical protein
MAPRNSSPRLEIADFINNDTYRNPTECREPVVRTMDCTVYWTRWREEKEEKKQGQEIVFEQNLRKRWSPTTEPSLAMRRWELDGTGGTHNLILLWALRLVPGPLAQLPAVRALTTDRISTPRLRHPNRLEWHLLEALHCPTTTITAHSQHFIIRTSSDSTAA